MIVWLDKALLHAVHDRQLAEHGGTSGVRDETLLDSALARPQQLDAYGGSDTDLVDLAATLAFGIARNHPFVDGNKRTAYVACRLFLRLNGLDFQAGPKDKFQTFLALAEGQLSVVDLATWLRERISRDGDAGLQEAGAEYSAKR